jgi:hypothetical protein
MIKNINRATIKEEIIEIIHPSVLAQIAAPDLNKIAERILLDEKIIRQEAMKDPLDVALSVNYSPTLNQITRIDYGGEIYKL